MTQPEQDRRVTTREAAQLLGIPETTISSWRSRRRITPVGMLTGRGRGGLVPIYLLSELRQLADATRRNATPDETPLG